MREGDDARMAVEIALLKAARPDLDPSTEGLLRRIEQLERAADSEHGPGEAGIGPSPPERPPQRARPLSAIRTRNPEPQID